MSEKSEIFYVQDGVTVHISAKARGARIVIEDGVFSIVKDESTSEDGEASNRNANDALREHPLQTTKELEAAKKSNEIANSIFAGKEG